MPLELASFSIWVIFIFDFLLRLSIANSKPTFIKNNWFMLITLLFPALRLFQFTRGLRLIKVFYSLRHTMNVIKFTLGKHGFWYVILLTTIVILIGAAGMYALESHFKNYGDALWWTAMVITTMGSDFWPQTIEGRLLCLALAIYAFAIFGYITAFVASLLIVKDVADKSMLNSLEEIKNQIKNLQNDNKDRN